MKTKKPKRRDAEPKTENICLWIRTYTEKRTRDSTTTTISIIRRHSLLPLSQKYEYRSNQQLSQNTEAPFSQEFIINFIKENVDVPSKQLITKIAECLKEKSSMHKFFVQSTSLQNKDDLNDLQIQSDFAALWDTKKDGCLSIQYGMNNEILIITIYWISI